MKEIVINCCYGGFSLSNEAILKLHEKKGIIPVCKDMFSDKIIPIDELLEYSNLRMYCESLYDCDVARDDADLVAVVKELGEKANGSYAKLKIVEIPDGIEWGIDEYDGVETIHEVHRSWS